MAGKQIITKVIINAELKSAEIPYLKLPANPQDLINMYDLKDRIILKKALQTNIKEYIFNFHNSFIKTG